MTFKENILDKNLVLAQILYKSNLKFLTKIIAPERCILILSTSKLYRNILAKAYDKSKYPRPLVFYSFQLLRTVQPQNFGIFCNWIRERIRRRKKSMTFCKLNFANCLLMFT